MRDTPLVRLPVSASRPVSYSLGAGSTAQVLTAADELPSAGLSTLGAEDTCDGHACARNKQGFAFVVAPKVLGHPPDPMNHFRQVPSTVFDRFQVAPLGRQIEIRWPRCASIQVLDLALLAADFGDRLVAWARR